MVSCPLCGSNDVNRLILNLCNGCQRVVGENRKTETDMDVVDFTKKLCGQSLCSEVYFTLLEAGGAQRFTDIRDHMSISSASLSRNLSKLLIDGLIRMRGKKYQALCPTWLKEAN